VTLPQCENTGPIPGAYVGPCVHSSSTSSGVKVMFKSSDGQLEELDDLEQLEGKRVMFQDSQGNMQELAAEAYPGSNKKTGSALPAFFTSPLVVLGALAMIVLGAVVVVRRRLQRSVTYEPLAHENGHDDLLV